jgi:hypothetical protein
MDEKFNLLSCKEPIEFSIVHTNYINYILEIHISMLIVYI